jgi:hypothetical protein
VEKNVKSVRDTKIPLLVMEVRFLSRDIHFLSTILLTTPAVEYGDFAYTVAVVRKQSNFVDVWVSRKLTDRSV